MEMHKFGTKTNAVSFNQTLARNAGKNKKGQRKQKTGPSPFSKNQFLEKAENHYFIFPQDFQGT